MYKSKVLLSFVLLLCVLLVVFYYNENYIIANISRSLVVPSITLLYLIVNRNKSICFTVFLVAYSISELLTLVNFCIPCKWEYFFGNSLYIAAYLALSVEIIKSIDIKFIFKYYKIHLLVLLVLNVYANYVLFGIGQECEYLSGLEFGFETIYNMLTVLLLSISLLNYFYRDDKKAFMLFLGTLCVVVSEVVQIAYFYVMGVGDDYVLVLIYSLLLILAFYFYYLQSELDYSKVLGIT